MSFATWLGLGLLVTLMVSFDLALFARGRVPTLGESALWSIGWLAAAAGFGIILWSAEGADAGSQYFAGYLLERSLSLDNVFVFAVLLGSFAIPRELESRLLGWGIALAVLLRLAFIVAGAALLDSFHATFYLFGALLLYTAWRLARHDGEQIDPQRSPLVRAFGGRPLLAAFAAVATTDLIFAIDSIPAIFAVTEDPFVVFAANAFAMLGLRALYFLVVDLRERFIYLSRALVAILAFVGIKMLLVEVWHVPIWLSLGVIVSVLALAMLLSLRATAPPGSVPDAGAG